MPSPAGQTSQPGSQGCAGLLGGGGGCRHSLPINTGCDNCFPHGRPLKEGPQASRGTESCSYSPAGCLNQLLLCHASFWDVSPSGMSSPEGLACGFLPAGGPQHPTAFPGGPSRLGAGRGGCDEGGWWLCSWRQGWVVPCSCWSTAIAALTLGQRARRTAGTCAGLGRAATS